MARYFFSAVISLIFISFASAQETVTITTYYPSPYGSYREMRIQRTAIGDNYMNNATVCWENCPVGVTPVPADTDLIVEGKVGIGTSTPSNQLHIVHAGRTETVRLDTTAGLGEPGYSDIAFYNNATRNWAIRANNVNNMDGTLEIFSLDLTRVVEIQNTLNVIANLGVAVGEHFEAILGRRGVNPNVAIGYRADGVSATRSIVRAGNNAPLDLGTTGSPQAVSILNNGNVGIGTTGPGRSLHVNGGTLDVAARFESTDAGAYIMFQEPGVTTDTYGIGINGAKLQLRTAGTDRLTIDSTGNVGIGTASPSGKLDIRGRIHLDWDPPYSGVSIEAKVPADASNWARSFNFITDGGTSLAGYGALGPIDGLTYLWMGPSYDSPWMVINTSGNVGIGTTGPNYKLDVRGTIGNNTTLYHSDIRWKKNISTISGALNKVLQLRGVNFEWKADEYKDRIFDTKQHIGFIAQEVENIIPQLVSTDKDGYKTMEYANIAAILVEATKELKAENDELKKRIEMLEAK